MAEQTTIVFAHGKESGPWGTKITYLADIAKAQGHAVISPSYQGMDRPQQRIDVLLAQLAQLSGPVILVGSSMGAYVSLHGAAHKKCKALFLMAPAVYMQGYQAGTIAPAAPCYIVHGWNDEIVPVDNAIFYARQYSCDLTLYMDDHRLEASLPKIGALFFDFLKRYA